MLTVGSLFSGIGGFDLGLERAGMRVLWQCEIDPYCQRVLAKHWPDVLCVPDIRELRADAVPAVDVLCGGFPCQDISVAGKGAGIGGERSGLWGEFARLIGELRPRYVLVENVSALLARGLDVVLGDLAALGFDAEWDCLPASAFGAPHRRDRLWLVAYPQQPGLEGQRPDAGQQKEPESRNGRALADDADCARPSLVEEGPEGAGVARGGAVLDPPAGGGGVPGRAVGRVAHGVPARAHRLRALGNALVPQIAEWIGHRILEWEGMT